MSPYKPYENKKTPSTVIKNKQTHYLLISLVLENNMWILKRRNTINIPINAISKIKQHLCRIDLSFKNISILNKGF